MYYKSRNKKSKIAQKTKNGQQVSCQRKQKNVEENIDFSGNVQRKIQIPLLYTQK